MKPDGVIGLVEALLGGTAVTLQAGDGSAMVLRRCTRAVDSSRDAWVEQEFRGLLEDAGMRGVPPAVESRHAPAFRRLANPAEFPYLPHGVRELHCLRVTRLVQSNDTRNEWIMRWAASPRIPMNFQAKR